MCITGHRYVTSLGTTLEAALGAILALAIFFAVFACLGQTMLMPAMSVETSAIDDEATGSACGGDGVSNALSEVN